MKLQITILLLFFAMSAFTQNMFIAHRGASYLAPENTVAAAKLAWELGADAVECDIYLTADNHVMVIHDKDTKRTCSGKKNLPISDSPSLLLRDLDAGSWKDEKYKGEKIPFLSEIIKTVPKGKILVVEIKCDSNVLPHLKRVVNESGKADQMVFIAFDWNTIVKTKKIFPDNKCYWLSSSKSAVKRKIPEAVSEGLDGVNLNHGIIDDEIFGLAKGHNLEVLAWTVDDPVEAKRLNELGVMKITTNRPKWLKEQLGKM